MFNTTRRADFNEIIAYLKDNEGKRFNAGVALSNGAGVRVRIPRYKIARQIDTVAGEHQLLLGHEDERDADGQALNISSTGVHSLLWDKLSGCYIVDYKDGAHLTLTVHETKRRE